MTLEWSLLDPSLLVISSTGLGAYLDPGMTAPPCELQRLGKYFVILDNFHELMTNKEGGGLGEWYSRKSDEQRCET